MHLVGGWTNPSRWLRDNEYKETLGESTGNYKTRWWLNQPDEEKYAQVKLGIMNPQGSGWKFQKCLRNNSYPFIRPFIGVITPFITNRGPPHRHDSDFLIPTPWICDSPRCLEKVTQHIFSEMVVNNGDESHGRIRKTSPNKQIQEIWHNFFRASFWREDSLILFENHLTMFCFPGFFPWWSLEFGPDYCPIHRSAIIGDKRKKNTTATKAKLVGGFNPFGKY